MKGRTSVSINTMKKRIFLTFFGFAMVSLALVSSVAFAANNDRGTMPNRGGQQQPQGQKGEMRKEVEGKNRGIPGTVTSVNGSQITITSRGERNSSTTEATYIVDTSSATIKKVGIPTATSTNSGKLEKPIEKTISISDIITGDMIVVSGTIQGTTITAKEILVTNGGGKMDGQKEPRGFSTSSTSTVRSGWGRENDEGSSTEPMPASQGGNFWTKITNPFKNFFKKIF